MIFFGNIEFYQKPLFSMYQNRRAVFKKKKFQEFAHIQGHIHIQYSRAKF